MPDIMWWLQKKGECACSFAFVALLSAFWHISKGNKLLHNNNCTLAVPSNKLKCEDQIFGGMTEQMVQKAWIKSSHN